MTKDISYTVNRIEYFSDWASVPLSEKITPSYEKQETQTDYAKKEQTTKKYCSLLSEHYF